jgi:tetratricopeptide (TPR) repeat protein
LPALSEIQRSDARAAGGPDAAAGAERDAKIEQLLLAGLDYYFAEQYEQAINVWTRALFLDRSHPRARAYIDRARGALAERQRQSEELLHNGVAAFNRGEGDEARRLLQAAIDGGAPTDEALALLERLNRPAPLDSMLIASSTLSGVTAREVREDLTVQRTRRLGRLITGAVLVVAVLIGIYIVSVSRVQWQTMVPLLLWSEPAVSQATTAPIAQDLSLPLPRRGEMALTRARALAQSGRLHEALTALDGVRATDSQKEEADRLRADLQRQLLALTPMPPPAPAAPERRLP